MVNVRLGKRVAVILLYIARLTHTHVPDKC